MKRDFDRTMERLGKDNLKVIGEQFVLQAQIKLMKDQNAALSTQHRDYDQEIKKKQFELEKEGRDLQRVRLELEAEMRNMETQHSKCGQEHYNNTMYLMKDARNELELKRRHDKEQELNTALIEKKTLEKEALDAELEALN